jgi:predicted RecA/RadA family phage recombinase
MRNFIQDGHTVTLTAPTGGITSGSGLLVGAIFGVAAFDAAAGADVEAALEGVFELPKAADTIAQGDKLYWDATNKRLTTTATDNTLVGVAIVAAAGAATTVRVRLNGTAV